MIPVFSNVKAIDVQGRILDFDCEVRPLSYLGGDYTTGDITAIAWTFLDEDEVHCEVQSFAPGSLDHMLSQFLKAYDEADIVVGHYVRGFDLPVIQGALLEKSMPPLSPKLVNDTKVDLMVSKYLSLSQESLAAQLGLDEPKDHMTQGDWRSANRLEPEGIKRVRERVTADVEQNVALYSRLKQLGWLKAPSLWNPRSAKSFRYRP